MDPDIMSFFLTIIFMAIFILIGDKIWGLRYDWKFWVGNFMMSAGLAGIVITIIWITEYDCRALIIKMLAGSFWIVIGILFWIIKRKKKNNTNQT